MLSLNSYAVTQAKTNGASKLILLGTWEQRKKGLKKWENQKAAERPKKCSKKKKKLEPKKGNRKKAEKKTGKSWTKAGKKGFMNVLIIVCLFASFCLLFKFWWVHVACFSTFFKICWVFVLFLVLFLVSYFFVFLRSSLCGH